MEESRLQLGGYSISELLKQYRKDLFDHFLPYLDSHIYDSIHGGFMCHIDWNGQHISTHKRTWYDGRGVWVYSYLYNHFGHSRKYLERAGQTVELLLSMESSDYPFWPWGYDRQGKALNGHEADIYGSLFVAEGLVEYSKATGEMEYRRKAIKILKQCIDIYDRDTYSYVPHYNSENLIPAPRVLGHWMIILNLCGHLSEWDHNDEIKAISDRCIKALMRDHLHPELDLLVEYLHHDFRLPDEPLDQFVYLGHGIEVLWMILEAARRWADDALWEEAYRLFRRHVEVAWDDVFGGVLHELTHAGKYQWLTNKVLWAQEEVLTGLMLLIGHTWDDWAISWFDKVYPYVREKFILHKHPRQLWINGGDRRMDEHHQKDRFENYHHPRHLMKNIQVLESMMEGGTD